jgi:hypothetical protein
MAAQTLIILSKTGKPSINNKGKVPKKSVMASKEYKEMAQRIVAGRDKANGFLDINCLNAAKIRSPTKWLWQFQHTRIVSFNRSGTHSFNAFNSLTS